VSTDTVLFELGTEELPAGEYVVMAEALCTGICDGLQNHSLSYGETKILATPRRLTVIVSDVATNAADTEQEVLGPPIAAAKTKEGEWSPAAIGFAKKQGVAVEALDTIATDKGYRLGLLKRVTGAVCAEVLPEIVSHAVAHIPVSKRMRWGRERHEFLRPVQWLMLLLGNESLDISLFGLKSGRITRGHRFHGRSEITIPNPDCYQEMLRDEYVIADHQERKALIREQVEALVSGDETAVIDDSLLDEVTGLVEWPMALRGAFDEAFLSVPRQALISSMREHQKYFHIESSDGSLVPAFITISNIESTNPQAVVYGNEKVIRPRLADAAFFFETDKATSLAAKSERLENVLFQRDLGTLAAKQRRISRLATALCKELDADKTTVSTAAAVLKADLVSDMVGEFPELQGIAGRHYALNDGLSDAVADAIEQHYWPKFSGDQLPSSPESAAVALADRLDTLVGIFGIGQSPTGSKDPFALRRASVAVIRLLLAYAPHADIKTVIANTVAGFESGTLSSETADTVFNYLLERLPAHYEDLGVSVEILRAVTAVGTQTIGDIDGRSLALQGFAGSDEAISLAAANKRVANILSKTEESLGEIDPSRFEGAAESTLFESLQQTQKSIDEALAVSDFAAALNGLTGLRGVVDNFFDQVLVNAEDDAIRLNRLALLKELRGQFLRVADLAVLAR
jgi:glycyl-tRNA synthetase beta chain